MQYSNDHLRGRLVNVSKPNVQLAADPEYLRATCSLISHSYLHLAPTKVGRQVIEVNFHSH